MTTRIALTLAGGVSLGAYQAGGVYELLWALAHRPPGQAPILIDVITGASAGSLTGAVLARALTQDSTAADELYRAWVTEISFDSLTAEQPPTSLLSDRRVREIAKRIFHLEDEGLNGNDPQAATAPAGPHPAGAPRVLMAFALSNLNGVNYRLGYPGGSEGFDTTVFSDWIVFSLDRGAPAKTTLWQEIARAAIASGAVPVAFPTVKMERRVDDYRGSDIAGSGGTRSFTYVDGGLFNNEPVGLARDIVDRLEASSNTNTELDQRVYILIDPFVAPNLAEPEYAEEPLGYRRLLGRLLSVIMGEASKRDWIRATRTNRRLQWQDQLLQSLAEAVAALPPPALAKCAASARNLANDIAGFKAAYEAAGRPVPADAMHTQFAPTVRRLGPMVAGGDQVYAHAARDRLSCETFLDLAYAIENVAGLRKKVDLTLHVVAPKPGTLAGDFLGNFGGFFEQDWREHDWRRGRADARDLIVEKLGMTYALDDPEKYVPAADLSRVCERDIPSKARIGLERSLRGGIAHFLSPTPLDPVARLAVGAVSWILATLAVYLLMKRRSSCA